MLGYNRPMTGGATHYHTTEVNPVWNSGLVPTTRIGVHQFYRFPNRAERAYYQEALERRRGSGRRAVAPAETDLIPEASDAATEVEAPATESEIPAATGEEVAT